ncbi:hypothetical protein AC578_687 [Pseudocercospora eumusae]|uniref:DH domain-containing protein n=1 Tax=Pseudocercospora eumusae TaxID=321146 RepID=A0A139HKQ4_9PEZI|nr:hypothetical protein AC578_687 [Pseudocercospora eumusae]
MAFVLPLPSNSPLAGLLDSEPHVRSSCSIASIRSTGTVQHTRLRSFSSSSFSSAGSNLLPVSLRRRNLSSEDYSSTVRSASTINLGLHSIRSPFDRRSGSAATSRRTSLASSCNGQKCLNPVLRAGPEPLSSDPVAKSNHEDSGVSLASSSSGSNLDDDEAVEDGDITVQHEEPLANEVEGRSSSPVISPAAEAPAFSKWVTKLRKRRQRPVPWTSPRKERWVLDDFDKRSSSPSKPARCSAHHKSDSQNSSLRFITSVRSATATLASASIATISRQWRRGHQRSSLISGSDPRPSIDSVCSVMDDAARQRAKKRREKLEELIRTEESYVADVKALSNAYCTVLPLQHTTTSFTRATTKRVIADILQLHDDMLGRLHHEVPFAEYDRTLAMESNVTKQTSKNHNRWHSVDGIPAHFTPKRAVLATIRQGRRSLNISRSDDHEETILRCSPQTIGAVAEIFANHLYRFAVYEEYGANYEMVQSDVEDSQRNVSNWFEYDKAIEAISAHINPLRSRQANQKKAMTVKDLLIKPIQRIPRYELLFADLANLTPVCDDPNAHATIEELRVRLGEVCQQVNAAKETPPTRVRAMATTWLIGERLAFSSQIPRSMFLKLLGPVSLCGCLYIAYRSRERIKGLYVICILFDTHLVLASANEDHPTYNILACIMLAHATLEETDNQKGLQCHTAPHSWKVVFESSGKMYELIMSACSAVEADAWRNHVCAAIDRQSQAETEDGRNALPLSCPLAGEMRSVGKALGKPSSFVRKMSRAATVGPSSDMNQVIIKNTQAVKEVQENGSQTSLQIPRSQSVQSPVHIQTLAPRRGDRLRLEGILADVWSRDVLPYPGMMRRSDPIRASANHVIRKFSMASITSNFSSSKRTPSYTSVNSGRKEDTAPSRASRSSRHDSFTTATSRHIRPVPVNFHTAPDQFLPADFDIQDPAKSAKKSAFRTFTLTMERPFGPLLSNENKPSSLRRAQSVREDVPDDHSPPMCSPTPPPLQSQAEDRPSRPEPPVYSVVQESVNYATALQPKTNPPPREALPARTPKKTKSRLFRMFH